MDAAALDATSRSCCDACLCRGLLIGALAPDIEATLESRRRNPRGVLALSNPELVAAVSAQGPAARLPGRERVGAARSELERVGLYAVCMHAEEYPAQLHQLDDAPACLFVRGRARLALEALATTPAVALVGSRRPSGYGLEMGRMLGRGLGSAGVPVVSGLALGIDAAAHEGCLAGGGLAIALLAGGADVPYPRTNRRLYERIVECGAVMSEMPPGQAPFRWGFPARNRIMAALSEATVVVEAAPRSGSLITSDCASDLGKLVAAVPGPVTNRGARGSNALLRSGAAVITETRDVLDELFGSDGGPGTPVGGDGGAPVMAGATPPSDGPAGTDAVVLEGVEKGWEIGQIGTVAGIEARMVRASLARLEAAGHIRRDSLSGYMATAGVRGDA